MDCLFCKIVQGEIPSKKIYEDELVYAFEDITPQAPVHVLIIPKEHISSALEVEEKNEALIGHIFTAANKIAKDLGIDGSGFRIVNNCGDDGGQTVHHIHFHLLGGRGLQWPPG